MGPVQPVAIRRPRPWNRRLPRSRAAWHRRLRPSPAALRHWLVVGVLAWALASLVAHAQGRAEAAQAHWGSTTRVWVSTRPLRPGDQLAGAVRAERWPVGLAPASALAGVPEGGRAAGPVDPGSVVTAAMVERRGPARRTVAVPVPAARLPAEAGDRVDVWATADPSTVADGEAATQRVAVRARVTATTDRSVVLEVAPDEVEAVAEAGATATITLAGGA